MLQKRSELENRIVESREYERRAGIRWLREHYGLDTPQKSEEEN
jgi:hypothetical protein